MLTCVWPVLLMCGPIFCEPPSGVMPRLYFSRDLEETEKEEQDMPEKAETMVEFQSERPALVPMFTADKGGQTGPRGVYTSYMLIQQFPTEHWSIQPDFED